MKTNRIWKAGTVVVVVAVIALGWFLGVAPMLEQSTIADTSRVAVDAENAVHQQELISLQKQFEGIDELRAQAGELEKSIPASADMSKFIIQLNSLAAMYGVTLKSISTADSQLYSAPENAVAPIGKDGNPVSVAPADFITIPIVLSVSGPYQAILDFTKGLQSGDRLFLASNLVVASGVAEAAPPVKGQPAAAPAYTGEISGMVFVLLNPNAPAEVPAEGSETPDPAEAAATPVVP